MKIKVKPEGRDGVWIADKESIIEFLENHKEKTIHNFLPAGSIMLGADWDKKSVIKSVRKSLRIAVLTGDSLNNNMGHALAVIVNNKLEMFDIGKIEEKDLIYER